MSNAVRQDLRKGGVTLLETYWGSFSWFLRTTLGSGNMVQQASLLKWFLMISSVGCMPHNPHLNHLIKYAPISSPQPSNQHIMACTCKSTFGYTTPHQYMLRPMDITKVYCDVVMVRYGATSTTRGFPLGTAWWALLRQFQRYEKHYYTGYSKA